MIDRKRVLHVSSKRLDVELWSALRTLVFQRDNYTCRYCGARGSSMHCDHIVPLARGGTNSVYNLQTLCMVCNIRKSDNCGTFVIEAQEWALWHRLIVAEPRLILLFQEAITTRDDFVTKAFCANDRWYRHLKPVLVELVGDRRKSNKLLGTNAAYDVAYEVIYNALPNCRNCWCG